MSMIKRRGSFRERRKPLISLRNVSDQGSVVIPKSEYQIVDPIPDTWIMIKPGDILVSHSGTQRLILKKNWQQGEVKSLRITCEEKEQKLEASLEVEKMNLDSSNFDFLKKVLRPNFSSDISPHEYRPEFFTRAVRYNILTFLGFGQVGAEIYNLMPSKDSRKIPEQIALLFFMDTSNNILYEVFSLDDNAAQSAQAKENCIQIEINWKLNPALRCYQINQFYYPPDTNATSLETITLACEVANALSLTHVINSLKH